MEGLKTNIFYNIEKVNCEKNYAYLIFKRLVDVIGSLVGLILLIPTLVLTSILIKLESDGPIIFSQERVGFNGKIFKMYKFRSMVSNSEELKASLMKLNEMSGPMFKIKRDPRVTMVGRFIRKTSIDELPQLINVLRGEMSLVGPRPNLPIEVSRFSEYHRQKLLVKPGLTCYWQVMGRTSIGFEEWMDLDIKYICERNTWIDIKLIIKTILILFGDENAV
ncbi:MAG: sugar transferase [Clostridiaceae bacterium]|nr:sugar transferase [Clostridiaceae bacterium]